MDIVGEELAHEVAVEVFGFKDADYAFGLLPRKRGLVSGLIGATKSVITGGSKIGGAAIDTTAGMVKNIAVGSDGKSGLAGENGLGSTILNTAGNVANTMLGTAQSIGERIFGGKEGESRNIMDITKDVANSMVDCVGRDDGWGHGERTCQLRLQRLGRDKGHGWWLVRLRKGHAWLV